MKDPATKRTTSRYRNLRSGVRSFTESFTGILNGGFERLADYAVRHGISQFQFDLLRKTSVPPGILAILPWGPWLPHPEPVEWLERIGCGVEHVLEMNIRVQFDLATARSLGSGESAWQEVDFEAWTLITDDRGAEHRWHLKGAVFFGFPHYTGLLPPPSS